VSRKRARKRVRRKHHKRHHHKSQKAIHSRFAALARKYHGKIPKGTRL
jgi:hypothetical protein